MSIIDPDERTPNLEDIAEILRPDIGLTGEGGSNNILSDTLLDRMKLAQKEGKLHVSVYAIIYTIYTLCPVSTQSWTRSEEEWLETFRTLTERPEVISKTNEITKQVKSDTQP